MNTYMDVCMPPPASRPRLGLTLFFPPLSRNGDILAAAEEEFHTFKCSCGTVDEDGHCEPTEGPTNPLNRLKEKAKEMFGRGVEVEDREEGYHDTGETSENQGVITENGEVYHDEREQ